MRILNIKNIIAFVFAWIPKKDRRITVYVSYASRKPNGEYLKTILIKLGFIAYVEPEYNCSMVLHKPRYVFYPPVDLQPDHAIATIYLGDYDISPSELGPERFNRTLDTCKELACNLKSHINEIEYIDWDCAYNLEDSDKELFGKYVCVVKDDGSEHNSLTTEWNSHHHNYLVPSELTKDASDQRELFVDTSLHHTDGKPVETYDTKGQYDQLINDRQKTKNILTKLADKLTRNTSCNDIYNIMEYFQNIDVHDENFNQCCVMFRHAVNIALKLDTDLNVILGVSTLRLAADIEIDGSASSRMCNGIIIAKGYNYERSLCEKCPLKKCTTPCDGNIFADKFGYIIRKCNQYNEKTSKINILLKYLTDINIPHAYHPDSKLTNLFTNGYIEIIFPEPNTIKNVYAILDQFRPFFYFREAITNNGSINIWIYETRKSYEDHVHYILNNCKHNKETEKEKKNAEE